jgi:hypothetical protein
MRSRPLLDTSAATKAQGEHDQARASLATPAPLVLNVVSLRTAECAFLDEGEADRNHGVRPGTLLIVTANGGGRIRGVFEALHPMILELHDRDGKDSSVARSDVASIVASGASDSSINGALTGAGIGLAAAGTILGTIGPGDGYVLPSAKWGAPLLLSAAGGLLGMAIDRAHRDEQLLYEAVRGNAEAGIR